MPFTGNRQFKRDPRMLVASSGAYYRDADGRRIFDGLSGLWNCGAGHCVPAIAAAIRRQAENLDYSPAFQFGHPGAFELADRLRTLAPGDLDRVFFTNSGSEAVDTALKMALAYWRARGQGGKTRLISRMRGYHGVNLGGTSVSGIGANRRQFGAGLSVDHLSDTVLPGNAFARGEPEQGAELANELLRLVALHDAGSIAAVIVEPVAGSTGVLPPPRGYLQRLREICDAHDILLIFDEVITGLGRLGSATGAEHFGVVPDLMALSKQLTNGAVPIGAVIARKGIHDAFMDAGGPEYAPEFAHGYTTSAHPLACAAALATLDHLESESLIARARSLAPHFERAVHGLRGQPWITDIRNCGLAAGITLEPAPGEPGLRPFQVGLRMWQKGFYVRWGGDTIQLGPPFIATEAEIDTLLSALGDSITELARGNPVRTSGATAPA
jgi:beta-alanine--pyruvate transaminase